MSKHFEKNLYWKNIKQNGFPKWLACGFPHAAVHTPAGTNLTIYDFSVSSPEYNYTGYILNSARLQVNGSIFTQGESLGRWFTPGWVGPIYQSISPHHNRTALYPDLYRLLAATNMILFYRPTKNTPEIFGVRACVNTPHAVLVGNPNITMLGKSFHITCNNCILTINSGLPKNQATFLLIHQPPHRLLPVSLDGEWFDDPGLYILQKLDALIRPKRFVAALILGITALISIITSLALSTAALVQEVHTAYHANELSHNISLALTIPEKLGKKLETRINALEDTIFRQPSPKY